MLRRLRNESWRYITYSLVHEDKEHILANLLLLVCLGLVLEMVHGCWRVGLISSAGSLSGLWLPTASSPSTVCVFFITPIGCQNAL